MPITRAKVKIARAATAMTAAPGDRAPEAHDPAAPEAGAMTVAAPAPAPVRAPTARKAIAHEARALAVVDPVALVHAVTIAGETGGMTVAAMIVTARHAKHPARHRRR